MISNLSNPGGSPAEVGHDDMLEAVQNKTSAVVDVREPHEFAAGHIPGAVNLPLSRFDPGALPIGRPLVFVCQAGGRSAKALRAALEAGVENVRHYAPGTGGWRAAGGQIEK